MAMDKWVEIRKMTAEEIKQRDLIQQAIDVSLDGGKTSGDERRLALIEALLRDALGQEHGVWR
jgi:hypothetical protein